MLIAFSKPIKMFLSYNELFKASANPIILNIGVFVSLMSTSLCNKLEMLLIRID